MTTFATSEKENNSLFLAVSLMIGEIRAWQSSGYSWDLENQKKGTGGYRPRRLIVVLLESKTKEEEDMTDQAQLFIGKDDGAKYDSSLVSEKSFCHFYSCHLYVQIVLL